MLFLPFRGILWFLSLTPAVSFLGFSLGDSRHPRVGAACLLYPLAFS